MKKAGVFYKVGLLVFMLFFINGTGICSDEAASDSLQYFSLFYGSVSKRSPFNGYIGTISGVACPNLEVDSIDQSDSKTIDFAKVKKIVIVPPPKGEEHSNTFNNLRVYMVDGQVVSARRERDLYLVIKGGKQRLRIVPTTSKNIIFLKTE